MIKYVYLLFSRILYLCTTQFCCLALGFSLNTSRLNASPLQFSSLFRNFKISYDNIDFIFETNGAISFPHGSKLLCLHSYPTRTCSFPNWDSREKTFIGGHLKMCCVHMVFLAFSWFGQIIYSVCWYEVVRASGHQMPGKYRKT